MQVIEPGLPLQGKCPLFEPLLCFPFHCFLFVVSGPHPAVAQELLLALHLEITSAYWTGLSALPCNCEVK